MCVKMCWHCVGSLSSMLAGDIVPCLLLTEFVPLPPPVDRRPPRLRLPCFPCQRIPPSIPRVSNDRRPPATLRDAGPSGPWGHPPPFTEFLDCQQQPMVSPTLAASRRTNGSPRYWPLVWGAGQRARRRVTSGWQMRPRTRIGAIKMAKRSLLHTRGTSTAPPPITRSTWTCPLCCENDGSLHSILTASQTRNCTCHLLQQPHGFYTWKFVCILSHAIFLESTAQNISTQNNSAHIYFIKYFRTPKIALLADKILASLPICKEKGLKLSNRPNYVQRCPKYS